MPSQRTDASVAFSVTDNLSQSIVGMKNSVNSFKQDVTGLQQQLDKLDSTRFQLKNFDLKEGPAGTGPHQEGASGAGRYRYRGRSGGGQGGLRAGQPKL